MRPSQRAGTPATEYRAFINPKRNGVLSDVLTPSGWGRNRTRMAGARRGVPTVPIDPGLPLGPLTSSTPREVDGAFPVVVDAGEARSLRVVEAVDVDPPPLAGSQLRGGVQHHPPGRAAHVLARGRVRI